MSRTFEEQVQSLLDAANKSPFGQSNGHVLFDRKLRIYMRVGRKMIDDSYLSCMQLASLSLPLKYQRQGVFSEMLKVLLTLTDKPIYIEVLLNQGFCNALLTRGFKVCREHEGIKDVVLLRNPLDVK